LLFCSCTHVINKKTNNTHTHTQIHKETKVVQALHYKEEEEAKKKINNKNQFEI
jgi:hypothetical protein